MKASASSTRNLIVAVLVLAADFYLIRDCLTGDHYFPYFRWPVQFQFGFLGSLPMLDAVVLGGSVVLSRGGDRRPFLTGFVLSGAAMIGLLLGLSLMVPQNWFRDHTEFIEGMTWKIIGRGWLDWSYQTTRFAIHLALYTWLFTLPELLIATAVGYVARSSYCRRRRSE